MTSTTPSPVEEPRPTIEEILAADHAWYHTIDLAPGVATPGWIDLRKFADLPHFPDLKGKRSLDCGTFDGFWAFQMERLGADVVAIDIDEIPPRDVPVIHRDRLVAEAAGRQPGTGFRLLKRYFGSGVDRVSCPIQELSPDRIGGDVDVAFIGALLMHLRDPMGALERVCATLRPGGLLVLLEVFAPEYDKRKVGPIAEFRAFTDSWTYWVPNKGCLDQWLRTAGFSSVEFRDEVVVPTSEGHRLNHVVVHATR